MKPIEPSSERPFPSRPESPQAKKEEIQQLQEEVDISAVGVLCATIDHTRGVGDAGKSLIQKKVEKGLDTGKLSGGEALQAIATLLTQNGVPGLLGVSAVHSIAPFDQPTRVMLHLQAFAFFLHDKLPQNPALSVSYHKTIDEAKKLFKQTSSLAEATERLGALISEANRFLRASERYPLFK